MDLQMDAHGPIPIRRQLTEQLKRVIEGGGVPRDQALLSIRELAGFLGINPNTVARVIEDLKRSGDVEARRGKGVFVAPAPLARPAPHLREGFLQDTLIRAAALGMTRRRRGGRPLERGRGPARRRPRQSVRPGRSRVLARMATTGIYLLRGVPRDLQRAARVRAVSESAH